MPSGTLCAQRLVVRHRSLENTIQIVGVGLDAGAIASGVIIQHIDKHLHSLFSSISQAPSSSDVVIILLESFGYLVF
jgi:hypothetical protein